MPATANKTQAELDLAARRKLAAQRAIRTAKWAKTMTNVLISKSRGNEPRWHVVNFVGPKKSECRGIVDLLAIRKSHRPPEDPHLKLGDLFEVVLIQVKGGSAKWPSEEDRERLRLVRERYHAKEILLSEWKKGATPTIYRLIDDSWGDPIDPATVFRPNGKPTAKKRVNKADRRVSQPSVVIPSSEPSAATSTSEAPNPRTVAAKKAWAKRKAVAKLGKKT